MDYAAMLLNSSFHPCNVYRDCHRGCTQ